MKNTQRQLSDLDYRINRARLTGANKSSTLTEFKNYLLELGLSKYEKSVLPLETMEDNPLQAVGCETVTALPITTAKIIPFPGVSLKEENGGIQVMLEGFLREIGYIE